MFQYSIIVNVKKIESKQVMPYTVTYFAQLIIFALVCCFFDFGLRKTRLSGLSLFFKHMSSLGKEKYCK